MGEERVTICIPHLMREKLLRRCLQSLRENVDLLHSVIIINDGKRPLHFKDSRIKAVNSSKRMTVGEKKRLFRRLVKTEYLFRLDNDVLIRPRSLEFQIEALDHNPRLAAVSGIRFEKGIPRCLPGVADFKFVGKFIVKRKHTLRHILACDGDLFEADFIPTGYTTFRMKALEEISFDPNYQLGYSHFDTFLQFYFTEWKCAVHKKSYFDDVHHESPPEYQTFQLRARKKGLGLIEQSRRYFVHKWNFQPVDIREKTIFGKMLFSISYLHNYLKCPHELRSRFSSLKIFKVISKLIH